MTRSREDRREPKPEAREAEPVESADATDRAGEVERPAASRVAGTAREGEPTDSRDSGEGATDGEDVQVEEVAEDALVGLKAIGDAVKGAIDGTKAGAANPTPGAGSCMIDRATIENATEAPIPVAVSSQPNGATTQGNAATASVAATAGEDSRLSGETAATGGEGAGKREGGGTSQGSSTGASNAAATASSTWSSWSRPLAARSVWWWWRRRSRA